MKDITITTIDEVINQLGGHLGGWIFKDGKLSDEAIAIDTRELLKAFKEHDLELDFDKAKELCNVLVDEYGDRMEGLFGNFTFGNIAINSDNSYNWCSPLSHDINIDEFEYNDTRYCAVMVHLGGDIRGNYSYYFILECDFDDLLQIEFYPTVEINDRLVADLKWYSDSYSVYDYENNRDVGEYWDSEKESLIERLMEDEMI